MSATELLDAYLKQQNEAPGPRDVPSGSRHCLQLASCHSLLSYTSPALPANQMHQSERMSAPIPVQGARGSSTSVRFPAQTIKRSVLLPPKATAKSDAAAAAQRAKASQRHASRPSAILGSSSKASFAPAPLGCVFLGTPSQAFVSGKTTTGV